MLNDRGVNFGVMRKARRDTRTGPPRGQSGYIMRKEFMRETQKGSTRGPAKDETR